MAAMEFSSSFAETPRLLDLDILDSASRTSVAGDEIPWPPSAPAPVDSGSGTTASYSAENRPLPKCAIVFSDTDNDVVCVKNTLRLAGIVNKRGEIDESVDGLSVIHTGDLIDKRNPDPAVIEFWESLRQRASRRGCQVKIMAGNHELEAWQRMTRGETFRLPKKRLTGLRGFIEGLDLIRVEGSVLFLHGYPTLGFLRTLLHFREVTGKDPNRFNEDHFRRAFKSAEAINQYAYVKGKAGDNYILGDVAEASGYYKKHGRNVATILRELDIHTVVHGHRPQRSGVQADYEFARWIPGVRMISNDTKVRERGIGATVIHMKPQEEPEVVFINTLTDNKKTRKQVSGLLRVGVVVPPALSTEPPETPEPAETGPEEVVAAPGVPPVAPPSTPEPIDTAPEEVAVEPMLSLVEPPSTPEPIDTGPEEVAVVPTLPLMDAPGRPQPGHSLVDETAPLLPEDSSEGAHPRPHRRESESRYRRRAKRRWSIATTALTASLAGLGVYWLEGKYQRDPAEIQQAYHQEKTYTGRPAAEMARRWKEL